jgi:hypothetical protein
MLAEAVTAGRKGSANRRHNVGAASRYAVVRPYLLCEESRVTGKGMIMGEAENTAQTPSTDEEQSAASAAQSAPAEPVEEADAPPQVKYQGAKPDVKYQG